MAAAERKGKEASAEDTLDHFEKMLEGPCLNHNYPIKHAYKDCGLMKSSYSGAPSKRMRRRSPTPEGRR
jgi:hypothetical protein